MATTPMSRVVGHLRRVALLQEADRLTDAQLLESFLGGQEDAAFEALVRRHGPMILGVCRRVLHDRHDAEDAFQATFLVLLRKAAGIGKRELLVNWLYGVARRTALQARKSTARRRVKERQVEDMAQKQVTGDDAIQDMLPLLDKELSRLPDKYRVPIILCDLEGKTRKKAARQLGLPEGTLSMRLDRARAMLAKRLARHGTALSGSALALAVSQNMAAASVPPSLVASTVKIATLVTAGKTGAAAAVSAKVAALTEGVVKTMLLTKLKTVTAVLLVVAVFGIGAGTYSVSAIADNQRESQKQEGQKKKQVQAVQEKGDLEKDEKKAQNPPKNFTNGIGMKFVWIPPGAFLMGSPANEKNVVKSENSLDETQHKVTLTKGFYMGVHLVTQEEWQGVMGNNPSHFKNEKNLPVDDVSWEDCQEFIKKLREKDKNPYRLPTEAEWEFACRAGTTTPFHFGETISTDQANFNGTSYNGTPEFGRYKKGVFREKTTPVDTFPANAWGLHDMHGNLWQWCQDWFGGYPQIDVVDSQGPNMGRDRVQRGGSFFHYPVSCTSGRRNRNVPDFRAASFGFRLCFGLDRETSKPKQPDVPKTNTQARIEKRSGYVDLMEIDLAKGIILGDHVNIPPSTFTYKGRWQLLITPTTKFIIDRKEAQFVDLQMCGHLKSVHIEWEFDVVLGKPIGPIQSGRAIRVEVKGPEVKGIVQSINIDKNILTAAMKPNGVFFRDSDDGPGLSFGVAKDVEVKIDGKPSAFADLKPNMVVSLQMSVKLLVLEIAASGPKVKGVVKTVNAERNTISVNIPSVQMTAERVPVAKDAKVVIDGNLSRLSDLKAGMRITLQMSAEPEPSLVIGITAGKTAE